MQCDLRKDPKRGIQPTGAESCSQNSVEGSRTTTSDELLGSDGILTILHAGERYVLRRTRNGRLIMTK